MHGAGPEAGQSLRGGNASRNKAGKEGGKAARPNSIP